MYCLWLYYHKSCASKILFRRGRVAVKLQVLRRFLALALLLTLTAGCTAAQNPPAAESSPRLDLLEQLDPQADDTLAQALDGEQDLQEALIPSELFYGSFTQAGADEVLILYRFPDTPPHGAGYDHAIAALYDRDTRQLLSQRSLTGDRVSVHVFPTQGDGRCRVFVLCDTEGAGAWTQTQELFLIDARQWQSQPLDPTWWIPYQYDRESYTETFTYCVPGHTPDTLLACSVTGTLNEEAGMEYTLTARGTLRWDSGSGGFLYEDAPNQF